MKTFSAVIEQDAATGLYACFVPGFPRAHSQGETLEALEHNLQGVIAILLEDGEPELESHFVGVQNVAVA
jgi:predicted RNase H-like HicB family nuclease